MTERKIVDEEYRKITEEVDERIENWAELRRKYWDEFLPWQELDS